MLAYGRVPRCSMALIRTRFERLINEAEKVSLLSGDFDACGVSSSANEDTVLVVTYPYANTRMQGCSVFHTKIMLRFKILNDYYML